MRVTKLYPVLLFAAACGDNLDTQDLEAENPPHDHEPGDGSGGGGDETPPRDFYASPLIYFPSCDAPLASFEADARYVGDTLELVPNIRCLWRFDDGATFEGCVGEHVFEVGDWHDFTVEITNLDTGEVRTASQRRYVYPPIEATLEVTTSDLSISYVATTNRGNEVHVFVEPFDKIIVDDPLYHLRRENTVQVTEPGVYRVILDIEDERGVGPICSKRIEKEVTVVCNHHDDHAH